MRQTMGEIADVYQRLGLSGKQVNESLINVLRTWQREGLQGVRRLVDQGLAPALVLGALARYERDQQPSGQ